MSLSLKTYSEIKRFIIVSDSGFWNFWDFVQGTATEVSELRPFYADAFA